MGATPIVLMSSGWKRPLCDWFLFYGMVSSGRWKERIKGQYPEVCKFPKQLIVVFVDRKVRVIFDNGADIHRRGFRKRDGHARTGGAACRSYCPRIIVSLLLFLLCHRFIKGCVVTSVKISSPMLNNVTLYFRQGYTLFKIVVPVVGLLLRLLEHKVERHRFTNLIRNKRFCVCG